MQRQFYKNITYCKRGDTSNLYSNKWIGEDGNLIFQIEKNLI